MEEDVIAGSCYFYASTKLYKISLKIRHKCKTIVGDDSFGVYTISINTSNAIGGYGSIELPSSLINYCSFDRTEDTQISIDERIARGSVYLL